MPFNFTPLEYNPYKFTTGSNYPGYNYGGDQDHSAWLKGQDAHARGQIGANLGEYQGYAGNQFQSLFDAVNKIGASPFTSGDAFYNTPQYTPINSDPSPYTTHTPATRVYKDKQWKTVPGYDTFNQQGYNSARLDNMNTYLSDLGSFFRGLGSTPAQQAQQQIINNAPFQGATSPLPMAWGNVAGGGTVGNNPFGQVGVTGGGWGTPGAGYGLLGGGE